MTLPTWTKTINWQAIYTIITTITILGGVATYLVRAEDARSSADIRITAVQMEGRLTALEAVTKRRDDQLNRIEDEIHAQSAKSDEILMLMVKNRAK